MRFHSTRTAISPGTRPVTNMESPSSNDDVSSSPTSLTTATEEAPSLVSSLYKEQSEPSEPAETPAPTPTPSEPSETPALTPNPSPVSKTTRKTSAWYNHLRTHRLAYPSLDRTESVKQAKLTYIKPRKVKRLVKRDRTNDKPNAWSLHVEAWKKLNPDWTKNTTYKDVLRQCRATYTPVK